MGKKTFIVNNPPKELQDSPLEENVSPELFTNVAPELEILAREVVAQQRKFIQFNRPPMEVIVGELNFLDKTKNGIQMVECVQRLSAGWIRAKFKVSTTMATQFQSIFYDEQYEKYAPNATLFDIQYIGMRESNKIESQRKGWKIAGFVVSPLNGFLSENPLPSEE